MWRIIPGFSTYEVSNVGRVREMLTKKPAKVWDTNKGYYCCSLVGDDGYRRNVLISRCVALGFHGPRPSVKHGACHRDDNKHNDRRDNIYWGTQKQNVEDMFRNGRVGPHGGHAKLTMDQATTIRLQANYYKVAQLARRFGVSERTIYRVLARECYWQNLPSEDNP